MVVSLKNIPENSQVLRFITSGKPGRCKLCHSLVDKLEAHHLSYEPEIVIKLCHNCHHKVHFWPQRLNDNEIYLLLEKKFSPLGAADMINKKILTPVSLAKLIAPSRKTFLRAAQEIKIKTSERKSKSSHFARVQKFNKVHALKKNRSHGPPLNPGSSSG